MDALLAITAAEVTFSKTHRARAVTVHHPTQLPQAFQHLGLAHPMPSLVLIGGASRISSADQALLRSLFVQVLAPLAETLNAVVIDGGTNSGIMAMMGRARHRLHATFPLLGIAPQGAVALPGQPLPHDEAAPLEPHHTHFILVPGSQWGDESAWIAEAASTLSGHQPSVTILINGGEVTWRDAEENVGAGRPVIAIAGSGRAADALATALEGKITDERARRIVESGLLHAIDLHSSKELTQTLGQLLAF